MNRYQRAGTAFVHYLYHVYRPDESMMNTGLFKVTSYQDSEYYRWFKLKLATRNQFEIEFETVYNNSRHTINSKGINRDQLRFEVRDFPDEIQIEHFLYQKSMGQAGSDRFQSEIYQARGGHGVVNVQDFASPYSGRKFKYEIDIY